MNNSIERPSDKKYSSAVSRIAKTELKAPKKEKSIEPLPDDYFS